MSDRWVIRIVDGSGGTAGWVASLDALRTGDRHRVPTPVEWEAERFDSLAELEADGEFLRDRLLEVGVISDLCVLSFDRANPRVESPGSCPRCGGDEVTFAFPSVRQCGSCGHRWDRFYPGASVA